MHPQLAHNWTLTVYRYQRPRFLPDPQLWKGPQTPTLLPTEAPPFALPSTDQFVYFPFPSYSFHLLVPYSRLYPASGLNSPPIPFQQRSNGAQTVRSLPLPENPRPSSASSVARPKASPTAKWSTLSALLGVQRSISRWLRRGG